MHYKDLTIWQQAMDLTAEIYRLTKNLPKEELCALTNRLRRAAVSIPSNIAEGNCDCSAEEALQFMSVARGSIAAVETQLLICVRLEYLAQEDIRTALSLLNEIERIINSTISTLRDKVSAVAE